MSLLCKTWEGVLRDFAVRMTQDEKRRLIQRTIILIALPIFVLLSAHRREHDHLPQLTESAPVLGMLTTALSTEFAILDSGCTSERGPLRILNFIARAAKATRRRNDAETHLCLMAKAPIAHYASATV